MTVKPNSSPRVWGLAWYFLRGKQKPLNLDKIRKNTWLEIWVSAGLIWESLFLCFNVSMNIWLLPLSGFLVSTSFFHVNYYDFLFLSVTQLHRGVPACRRQQPQLRGHGLVEILWHLSGCLQWILRARRCHWSDDCFHILSPVSYHHIMYISVHKQWQNDTAEFKTAALELFEHVYKHLGVAFEPEKLACDVFLCSLVRAACWLWMCRLFVFAPWLSILVTWPSSRSSGTSPCWRRRSSSSCPGAPFCWRRPAGSQVRLHTALSQAI